MREQVSRWAARSKNALVRDYPDPYARKSTVALIAAGAAVCVVAGLAGPDDTPPTATSTTSRGISRCLELRNIVTVIEPDKTVSIRNTGANCVGLYDYGTFKDAGTLAIGQSATAICLEISKPFAVELLVPSTTGTNTAAANASGQAYTMLMDLRGRLPDCPLPQ